MMGVLKLIEKQIALWEFKQRMEDVSRRPGRCLVNTVAYGPCLLVSRERGSGGDQLAHLVGERLGWQVFDREVLDEIAQRAHVRQQVIETVDEQVRSSWLHGPPLELAPEDIGREEFLRHLRQVLLALGHHGDVVILGRGAEYVLPAECALRVRLIAPFELRARRMAEREGMLLEQAKAHVQQFDSERATFAHKSFQCKAGWPLNYDVLINTGEISMEASLNIVLTAIHGKLGVRPQK